ncbi:MAG: selenocysteine-specific translation elongation factor [Synergistaceae bacterium]|jgi:selenocysteine-specific elongation factor|nr:selenocysteine-specific translation elongation factor [Synergistaceae bacterium]
MEISLVIGTAGHIDHGKTTLVKALTGVDCDRLIEEKRRGVTIELGFAPLRLGERVISVIDVPGHERFIRQMVAGASGIDAVLLVIAADEGVMPQTKEHLAILGLLGVRDGVIAITKADKGDLLPLVVSDVKKLVAGTFLERAEIIPVSATTSMNLDALRTALSSLVDRVSPRPRNGALFLPIDRAFSIAGFGTVVTGTAYRGVINEGDEVDILPGVRGSVPGKVRGLQVHGRSVATAFAGQRIAVNISNISVDDLARGDVLCKRGVYSCTRRFDAVVTLLPGEQLRHWQRVRLCIGTSDALARVSLLTSRSIKPGEAGEEGGGIPVQIAVEEDVVCAAGQRFIIRFYSPLATIGGGTVVFPYARRLGGAVTRRSEAEWINTLASSAAPADRLAAWVERVGLANLSEAAAAMQETRDVTAALAASLASKGRIAELRADVNYYLSLARLDSLSAAITASITAWQAEHGTDAPIDEIVHTTAGLDWASKKVAKALILSMAEKGALVETNKRVRTPQFEPAGDLLREKRAAALAYCRMRAFQPPTLDELRAELNMDQKSFSLLTRDLRDSKAAVLLSGGAEKYVLSSEVEEQVRALLIKGTPDPNCSITLASVRDATGSSRKYILPILEYLDSRGFTRRVGDVRVVVKKGETKE